MSNFAKAFGKKFQENKDLIRIRTFELGGHTFKVKIPLTAEYEALMIKVNQVPDELVEKYYSEMTDSFIKSKDSLNEELGIVFTDDDVEIKGRSMKAAAKNKAVTESRILAMVQMLVPEGDFNMSEVTYEMVEELFPFSVQIELIEKISEVINPTYGTSRGK